VAVRALGRACVWRPREGLVLDLTGKGFRLAGTAQASGEAAFSAGILRALAMKKFYSQTLPGPGTSLVRCKTNIS